MSLFPKVALTLLDWSAVLVAAGMSYATALSLLGRVPFTFEDTVLTGALGRLVSFAAFASLAAFFWVLHLVLRRSRLGQPFERRNVRALYVLANMHLAYVLLSTGALFNTYRWFQHLFSGQQVALGGSLSTDDLSRLFLDSGLLITLTLFAFAAIFQRGTELREEEARLRAEQALTI